MIGSLRRAAETSIGHEQMANHPCDLGPPLVVPLHPEQVDVEVRVGLQVVGVHAGEPPQVSLDPGAEVVHELHRLEVPRVPDVRLVGLVLQLQLAHQDAVRPLPVVDEDRALGYVGLQRPPDPGRRGLAVAADHGDGLLAGVDPDGDADLLLGEPPLPGLAVPLGEVGVVDVGLIHPGVPPQHDAVLVAVDGGEGPVPPLPGGLVGDAAHLRAGVERRGGERQPDEVDPGGKRFLAVLEDRPGEGVEPGAASGAAPSLHGGRREPVPPGRGLAAGRARGQRAVQPGGLGERAESRLLAEHALPDGVVQELEVAGGQPVDEPRVGVRGSHGGSSHPPERPPGGNVAKHRSGWALGQTLRLAGKRMPRGISDPNHHPFPRLLDKNYLA